MTGLPWLLREVYARRKVTIVNYHDPRPEVFEEHMACFSRVYAFISMDDLADALERRDFSKLPAKAMVVTLDDGYLGNAALFSIMKRYSVPAVIYAVAGVVDTGHGFWFDRLDHGSTLMRQIKSLPDDQRRETLARDFGHTDKRVYEHLSALSAVQLREFISLGGTVGSHTLFHPLLDHCDDATGIEECETSRAILEKKLNVEVRHFALPNGNCDARTRAWLSGPAT